MTEYIEREALIRQIDEGFDKTEPTGEEQIGFLKCRKIARELSAADVAPVVRCKDCRWLYDQADDYCCFNHKGLMKITPDSYCSYGEREEG